MLQLTAGILHTVNNFQAISQRHIIIRLRFINLGNSSEPVFKASFSLLKLFLCRLDQCLAEIEVILCIQRIAIGLGYSDNQCSVLFLKVKITFCHHCLGLFIGSKIRQIE